MHANAMPDKIDSPPPSSWNASASLAAALERAKEELEIVSYVTSHDLKAPLRAILAACEDLKGYSGIASDKTAQDGVQRITREADRLKTLMQGLLDYLNLETFGPAHSMIDCNEIVETARSILVEKIMTAGVKITQDDLPQVYGHRGRLSRLFVNLIDNALKFHGPLPLIHISARRAGGMAEFCVEDNGIGIDEEHHQIVFALFQRLHTSEAYPGYGIGLALSRKIVESHGGKIWIEPAPAGGCRFRFTLPVLKPST